MPAQKFITPRTAVDPLTDTFSCHASLSDELAARQVSADGNTRVWWALIRIVYQGKAQQRAS